MNWIVDINEKAVTDKKTPLPVLPGRPNTLTVRSTGRAPEAAFTAYLEVTTPDGRTRIETAALPNASLDLGPFTAPACYDFENGVVYRRGYRCLACRIVSRRSGHRRHQGAGWRNEDVRVLREYSPQHRRAGTRQAGKEKKSLHYNALIPADPVAWLIVARSQFASDPIWTGLE